MFLISALQPSAILQVFQCAKGHVNSFICHWNCHFWYMHYYLKTRIGLALSLSSALRLLGKVGYWVVDVGCIG